MDELRSSCSNAGREITETRRRSFRTLCSEDVVGSICILSCIPQSSSHHRLADCAFPLFNSPSPPANASSQPKSRRDSRWLGAVQTPSPGAGHRRPELGNSLQLSNPVGAFLYHVSPRGGVHTFKIRLIRRRWCCDASLIEGIHVLALDEAISSTPTSHRVIECHAPSFRVRACAKWGVETLISRAVC